MIAYAETTKKEYTHTDCLDLGQFDQKHEEAKQLLQEYVKTQKSQSTFELGKGWRGISFLAKTK